MKLMRCMQNVLVLATLGLLSAFAWTATPAGSVITNQAEIVFIDGESGRLSLVSSNVSRVTVAELRTMTIMDDRNRTVYAGQTVNLPHRLTNTGNIADIYDLVLTDIGGDSGSLINPRIIHDLNGNGLADAGEPTLTVTPRLNMGQSIDLVTVGVVPVSAATGNTFKMSLQGQSQADGSVKDLSTDTLAVSDQAAIEIFKQSSQQCSQPLSGGDALGYDIRFNNIGDRLADEQEILLDGVTTQGVLVQDKLPYGVTLYKPQTINFAPVQAVPVVQLFSRADSDQWITFDAWDGIAPVSSIGLLFDTEYLERNQSGQLAFGVRLFKSVTATKLMNKAFIDADDDNVAEFTSNQVCNTLAGPEASIRFLMPSDSLMRSGETPDYSDDDDFQDAQLYLRDLGRGHYSQPRDGVYVELTSTGLSQASYTVLNDGRRTVVVKVSSKLTGHSLAVELQETAPGSGVFRSVAPVRLVAQGGNDGGNCSLSNVSACTLLSAESDQLVVTFIDQNIGKVLDDFAIVDPLGEVFDSKTLLPIAGAIVTVHQLDGSVALDPLTNLPLTAQVTGADGRYHYPRMFPGDYYMKVVPPGDYSFPSTEPPAKLTPFGKVVSPYSYGRHGFTGAVDSGVFTLSLSHPLEIIDIPLDIDLSGARLILEKEASKKTVEIGSLVEYTLNIKNVGALDLEKAIVMDQPAYGFKYIAGTARLNGNKLADPVWQNSQLVFWAGDLAVNEQAKLQYVMQATSGAIDGDGINRAKANARIKRSSFVTGTSIPTLDSNLAQAKVEVDRTGVLSDRAFIFGKIYVDNDCNNIQNDAEWPISGVKVFMEDGTYAITDENGMYSLYGLKPGMHAVKLDPLTLPDGVQLKPIDNRNAGDPDSRFVDLRSGELHRADFAAQCPEPEDAENILRQLQQRNGSIQGDWMLEEASRYDPTGQSRKEDDLQRARKTGGDLSSGLIGAQSDSRGDNESSPENFMVRSSATPGQTGTTAEEEPEAQMPLSADVVKTVTQAQAKEGVWLWPTTDTSYTGRFMVVVKAGINPDLYVNGEKVSHASLGEQIVNKRERAQVLAWYGVDLSEGENQLEVKGTDPFGNERVLARGTFKHPARGVSLEIVPEREELYANGGRSATPVAVRLLDRNGYPARGVYFVTVEASDGSWQEADIQETEPGHQIKVVNGESVLHLRSSERTGNVILRASFEQMAAEAEVVQIAPMRPLVGLGLIDFTWRKSKVSHDGYGPTRQQEDFKDGYQQDGRGALLLKGRVKGDYHLTLSYDTDKQDDTELLRDIDPNDYYPIFGDSSVRGFEAQSRDKLYAKLEKGRSSVMWGDYVTDIDSNYEDLSRVQRTLTGARGIYDDGTTRAMVFGAEEKDRRGLVEFPGNGTAMLYTIEDAPIVRNSEVVELITRDRDNQGLIVNVEPLTRFTDYSIDYLSGNLRFTRSIPTLDDEFNPVFVRISFDLEGGGKEHLVAGGRIERKLTDHLTVGGSYTKDEQELDGYALGGGFVEYRLDDQTRILGSAATMNHQDKNKEDGDATFVTVEHSWLNGSTTRATWGETESGFTNSSGGVGSGRQETRIEHRQQITDKLSAQARVLESESLESGDTRSSKELSADYRVGDWTVRAGGRVIEQETSTEKEKINTILTGVSRGFTLLDRPGNVALEYEQETGKDSRKRWMADASWQAHEKARVYGRYEQINSLTGITGLSSGDETVRTSLGVETDWLPSTTLYNEYRLEGATSGRELEAATGVRGDYELQPGLLFSPSFEMIDTLQGNNKQDNTAFSLGLRDSRDENSRKIARVEARKSTDETQYGLDLSYASRINEDWSGYVREELRWADPDEGDDLINHTLTLGLAHRPRSNNKHHLLFMYQWQEERGKAPTDDRTAHLISVHSNIELDDQMTWSGRAGYKHEEYDLLGGRFRNDVVLLDTRLTRDITQRFDVDIHGGVLGTNGIDEMRYSYGVGVNYLIRKNLRIGVGYNFAGFEEDDLDGEGYNAEGVYFGIQYKFDEDMFGWLEGDD